MNETRLTLVTGGNRGIGKETARQLARFGMTVLLGSRDIERGKAAATELAADGVQVTPIQIDVADQESVEAAATWVRHRHGRLDVLINNAGIVIAVPALEITAAHIRDTFEVNVFGVVTTIRAMLPMLCRSTSARIVNVSSTTGSIALTASGADLPGDAERRLAYTSAKAALNMLTVQYAQAFARQPELAHIRINSVSPGYTATDMNCFQGHRHVSEGARAIVALARQDDGPTGRFFDDRGELPW